ncbi:MAG TPA: AtaL-like protein [Burkholderiaceae bacterium]|jgi:hypothetical protein|nr:AtaL-like protein [Burkholderiaceae bacterium]
MRFEHVIQVTDPGNPLVPPMSREELWAGVLARVDEPQRFPLGPDDCLLRAGAGGSSRERTLRFGALELHDEVKLEPLHRASFHPKPHAGQPPVRLTIAIEEPSAGELLLRFVYESDEVVRASEAALYSLREQAWLQHDLDMVRTLRAWQQEGCL